MVEVVVVEEEGHSDANAAASSTEAISSKEEDTERGETVVVTKSESVDDNASLCSLVNCASTVFPDRIQNSFHNNVDIVVALLFVGLKCVGGKRN